MKRAFTTSRLMAIVACATVVTCGGGDDGDAEVAIESLFPANQEIGAWAENTNLGDPGVEVYETKKAANDRVNGDADPFTDRNFAAFGREFYADGTFTLELRLWQMPDAATATDVYGGILQEDARYKGATWDDLDVGGTAGRIADTGSAWMINATKSKYFVEASGITPNDMAGQEAGQSFVRSVLAKIK